MTASRESRPAAKRKDNFSEFRWSSGTCFRLDFCSSFYASPEETITYPANAMVIRSSWRRIRIANSTPSCPLYCIFSSVSNKIKNNKQTEKQTRTANPQNGILPIKQKLAPNARALKISEPRRIPPSTAIGMRSLATGAQTRSASNVDGMPSSCRPPWFEMTTPSMPYLMANSISSGVVTANC